MLLRYFGSKKRTGRNIMSYAPSSFENYVEPFCGSANMLWHVPRSVNRWINDVNPDVVSFHLALRDDPGFLDRLFEYSKLKTAADLRLEFSRAKWDWYETGDPVAFWLLNRYGHARLVRRSRADIASFDAVYLIRGMKFPFTRQYAEEAREIMQDVQITNLDFREVMRGVPTNSWTFFDPPYHVDEDIYDVEFSYEDHADLRNRLAAWDPKFFMTIGLNELTHQLYVCESDEFDIREHTYQTMNLLKGGSVPCTELYIRNYLNF